jgi:hypothetical protein
MQVLPAMLEVPGLNLSGVQTTTHPLGPMLMVSGPVGRELGLASGAGALGPGWAANLSLGRALRLLLMNGGGARQWHRRRAVGSPASWRSASPRTKPTRPGSRTGPRWATAAVSTFTVVGAEAPHNISDHGSTDADGILRTMAGTLAKEPQQLLLARRHLRAHRA